MYVHIICNDSQFKGTSTTLVMLAKLLLLYSTCTLSRRAFFESRYTLNNQPVKVNFLIIYAKTVKLHLL